MADQISEWLGPEALPFRIMLGAVIGIFFGLAGLLVAILRLVVLLPLFLLFHHSGSPTNAPADADPDLLGMIIPYLVTFMVAGMVYGLIGSWRRTLITSIVAGCLVGGTLYTGIDVLALNHHGTLLARLSEDRSDLLFLAAMGGVVGGFLYLRSVWMRRRPA